MRLLFLFLQRSRSRVRIFLFIPWVFSFHTVLYLLLLHWRPFFIFSWKFTFNCRFFIKIKINLILISIRNRQCTEIMLPLSNFLNHFIIINNFFLCGNHSLSPLRQFLLDCSIQTIKKILRNIDTPLFGSFNKLIFIPNFLRNSNKRLGNRRIVDVPLLKLIGYFLSKKNLLQLAYPLHTQSIINPIISQSC